MKELTDLQRLNAKKVGHLWGMWGLILAMVMLLYNGTWYFTLFIFAMTWLQYWEYRSAKQGYDGLLKLEKEMEISKNV